MSLGSFFLAVTLAGASPAQDGTARSADGVPIHYTVTGAGEPALVFVHGWAIDGRYWDAQVPVFARTHRVVILDHEDDRKFFVQACTPATQANPTNF